MNNSEHNPTQEEQKKQAQASPLKEPQPDTEHNSPAKVNEASHNESHQKGQMSPEHQHDNSTLPHSVSLDVHNDNGMDSTVDTDGKVWDIVHGTTPDNTINNNASLSDSTDTPAHGLAGIDSRVGGNEPLINASYDYKGTTEHFDAEQPEKHFPLDHAKVEHVIILKS